MPPCRRRRPDHQVTQAQLADGPALPRPHDGERTIGSLPLHDRLIGKAGDRGVAPAQVLVFTPGVVGRITRLVTTRLEERSEPPGGRARRQQQASTGGSASSPPSPSRRNASLDRNRTHRPNPQRRLADHAQPILRYPGRLCAFGVLKTNATPSSAISSRSWSVSRLKMPMTPVAGCVAVSTARTAETRPPPAPPRPPHERPQPDELPIRLSNEHSRPPNGFASCFHRQYSGVQVTASSPMLTRSNSSSADSSLGRARRSAGHRSSALALVRLGLRVVLEASPGTSAPSRVGAPTNAYQPDAGSMPGKSAPVSKISLLRKRRSLRSGSAPSSVADPEATRRWECRSRFRAVD